MLLHTSSVLLTTLESEENMIIIHIQKVQRNHDFLELHGQLVLERELNCLIYKCITVPNFPFTILTSVSFLTKTPL